MLVYKFNIIIHECSYPVIIFLVLVLMIFFNTHLKCCHMQCKNVISKLQRRIDKEGPQIVPLLMDLWKPIENSGYVSGSLNNILDLRRIDQRIERLEYGGVMELVLDVLSMLRSAMHFYGFSHEVHFLNFKLSFCLISHNHTSSSLCIFCRGFD